MAVGVIGPAVGAGGAGGAAGRSCCSPSVSIDTFQPAGGPIERPTGGSHRELVLIRHAETLPDWSVPAAAWSLSSLGLVQARQLATAYFWNRVGVIYSSDETKALLTVEPAVRSHGLRLRALSGLREVRRPAGHVPDYPAAVREYLTGRGEGLGWEPLESAERRIRRSMNRILRMPPRGTLAVVSHGLVLTLYACRLFGIHDLYAFWQRIPFAGYTRLDPDAETLLAEFRPPI